MMIVLYYTPLKSSVFMFLLRRPIEFLVALDLAYSFKAQEISESIMDIYNIVLMLIGNFF